MAGAKVAKSAETRRREKVDEGGAEVKKKERKKEEIYLGGQRGAVIKQLLHRVRSSQTSGVR